MSLREEMWKYEQITGENAENVPIIKIGAFIDGYEMGTRDSVLYKIKAEIELHRRKTASIDPYDLVGDCLDIIDKCMQERRIINNGK